MDIPNAEDCPTLFKSEDEVKKLVEKCCGAMPRGMVPDEVLKLRNSFFEMLGKVFEEINETKNPAVQLIMYNKIHDLFMPLIKTRHRESDHYFFEKCKTLFNVNISPEQLGADENYTIRLSAAIVELSMLDSYKTPLEKMECLQTTYDLVYAELKTAMFSVISKYSEKEYDIPVINNDEVIPLLMAVIIKSKLEYLISNMIYITRSLRRLNIEHERDNEMIMTSFQTAIDNLTTFDEGSLEPSSELIKESLELGEYIRLSSCDKQNLGTVIGEDRERILNLISISTSDEAEGAVGP